MKILQIIHTVAFSIAVSLILSSGAIAQHTYPQASGPDPNQKLRHLDIPDKCWTGDFDQMLERRIMRVVVPYSRSLYFNDNGRERGLSAENIRNFERWINKKYVKKLRKRPLTIYIIPTTRDRLLPAVADGLGDIAVGNLTATKERLRLIDFVLPHLPAIKELLVTGPKSPIITCAEDLSGKTVHIRKASSYYQSLLALNVRFEQEGRIPAQLVLVPDTLEDEDMMEMLNAGPQQTIVVDDWKAHMWKRILPKIRVNEQVVVRESGDIGWATRKGSPKMESEIADFFENDLRKKRITGQRLQYYMPRVKQMKDPTGKSEWEHFEKILVLFEKYGKVYGFDPLMLAAQGYQESKLNQNARSRRGAIGVMQVLPRTGKELKVGDIRIIEPNIHAGSKYMDQLITTFFSDADFADNDRTLFAFASYNCGAGNVSAMRKEAAKRGFDPDKWFNNVEVVTGEKIGMETTTYVRNIYKYYVAYKLQRRRWRQPETLANRWLLLRGNRTGIRMLGLRADHAKTVLITKGGK